jgi:hypothetical protein
MVSSIYVLPAFRLEDDIAVVVVVVVVVFGNRIGR